jgi:predicted dehydrogenase
MAAPRVAFAGVGHWHAAHHLRSLLSAGARIVGVWDERADVAERVAAEIGCSTYRDWQVLFEQGQPDFALIMGRPNETGRMARWLLEAGVPFAAEKPLGTDASRLVPLVELERRHRAFAAVALVTRYSPFWQEVDELRAAGKLGSVTHAHFRLINGPPTRYQRDGVGWMLQPGEAGGGPLMNLGIHCFDALLLCVGEPVQVISAQVTYAQHRIAIEDYAAVLLRSASGAIGTVEAGYTYPSMAAGRNASGDKEWRLATSGAYIREDGREVSSLTLDGERRTRPCPPSSQYYLRFAADCLERLRRDQPPVATIADCYEAMCLVDAAYAQAGVRREAGVEEP